MSAAGSFRRGRSRPRTTELSVSVGFLYGLIAAWLYSLPVSFGGASAPMPWLAFVPVFFWAICRPRLSAAAGAFLLGLAQDALSGGPLGPWACGFLIGYAAAAFQRGQPAPSPWLSFAVSAGAVALGAFLAGAVALGGAPNVAALIAQTLSTILLAPLAAQLIGGLDRPTRAQGGML